MFANNIFPFNSFLSPWHFFIFHINIFHHFFPSPFLFLHFFIRCSLVIEPNSKLQIVEDDDSLLPSSSKTRLVHVKWTNECSTNSRVKLWKITLHIVADVFHPSTEERTFSSPKKKKTPEHQFSLKMMKLLHSHPQWILCYDVLLLFAWRWCKTLKKLWEENIIETKNPLLIVMKSLFGTSQFHYSSSTL